MLCVAAVQIYAIIAIVKALKNHDETTSEDPFQESNLYAPEHMFPTTLEKKLVAEYAIVGDPNLLHGQAPVHHKDADAATVDDVQKPTKES